MTPMAATTSPPRQQNVATTPALRGPTRSTHPPQMAAAKPRNRKNSVNVQPSMEIFQSQVVVKIWSMTEASFGQATLEVIPKALDSGSQNTEKPSAMPIQR